MLLFNTGLPEKTDKHAGNIASLAIELLAAVQTFRIPHRPNDILRYTNDKNEQNFK
jgi:hypothetical protein